MTCIVGVVSETGIVVGADSAGVRGHDITVRADEKVFIKGPMIFGFTSSFRMGQLLQYKLTIPEHPEGMNDHEYLSTLFIDSVRSCLSEGGFRRKSDDVESGGEFLVGYKRHIYKIQSDFQVARSVEPYDATGSGEDVALGVLYVTKSNAHVAVREALEAASKFKTSVSGPFNIKELAHE